MKKLLTLLLGLLGFASGCSGQHDSIKTVSAAEFAEIIKSDSVILVDVRTADEYGAGHIDGARNIDVLKDGFKSEAVANLPKDKTIAVYCRSGKRSLKAARILANEALRGCQSPWWLAGMVRKVYAQALRPRKRTPQSMPQQ